jgi:hypothetical protein
VDITEEGTKAATGTGATTAKQKSWRPAWVALAEERNRTPINHKNRLDRVLAPAANKARNARISHHMFRRGLATESLGVVDKNIQSQLRHADPHP